MKNIDKIVDLLFEVGSLRKIARSHRQNLLTDDLSDNIASHSFRVIIIGYFIAKMEGLDGDGVRKVMTMCTFHDLDEARSGDQNWLHKRYVKVFSEEILEEQFGDFEELFGLMKEYEVRESIESIIAKDADNLDQLLLLKEYELRGNTEAKRWINVKKAGKDVKFDGLKLDSSKKLFEKILEKSPNDWWSGLHTRDRR